MKERSGAAARGGVEALRLVRSAMRRVRVVLRSLPGADDSDPAMELREHYSECDEILGASRDIDVLLKFLTRAEAPRSVLRHFERARQRQVRARRRLLTGVRWAAGFKSMEDFRRHELPSLLGDQSAVQWARKRVVKSVELLLDKKRHASSDNIHVLHELRVAIRRVRLVASLFQELIPRSVGLIQAARACERALGRAHDASNASDHLDESGLEGVGDVQKEFRRVARRAIRKFHKYWPHLRRQCAAWA